MPPLDAQRPPESPTADSGNAVIAGEQETALFIRHMRIGCYLFLFIAVLHGVLTLLVFLPFAQHLLRVGLANFGPPVIWLTQLAILAWPASIALIFTFLAMCTLRELWVLTSGSLTHHGIFRKKRIELKDVVVLHWWPFNHMILVRGPACRIPMFLDSMSAAVKLQVIDLLHQRIPKEKQVHWSRFERFYLNPLRKRLARRQRHHYSNGGENDCPSHAERQ